jgi:hypothetical protein
MPLGLPLYFVTLSAPARSGSFAGVVLQLVGATFQCVRMIVLRLNRSVGAEFDFGGSGESYDTGSVS